jgi:Protein of unknown function (DUF3467)
VKEWVPASDVPKITTQVENMPTLYFNHARIASGYYDLRIFLGEQTVAPTGEARFSERMCVALTPEFARQLLTMLAHQVSLYEKVFGKLRVAPQSEEQFRKSIEEARKAIKQ